MNHRTLAAGAGMLLAVLMLVASAASAAAPGVKAAPAPKVKVSVKDGAKPRSGLELVSVVKDGVNLRSAPDTSAEVRFELPEGYPLEVIERKGDWINVRDYEGDKGWISASLVASTPYVIVKAAKGNIRSGPGTEYEQIGKVVRDVILKKTEEQGDWVKVSHPQLTGWIAKQLVWP